MFKEFKDFAVKGNFIDMAVGIVIGGAFGTIVSSFVKDIIMPPIGLMMGGVDFSSKVFVLKEAVGETAAVTMNYGLFINNIISFLIIAFSIFIVIKQINKLKKEIEEAPAEPTEEVKLLSEIRDSLKK